MTTTAIRATGLTKSFGDHTVLDGHDVRPERVRSHGRWVDGERARLRTCGRGRTEGFARQRKRGPVAVDWTPQDHASLPRRSITGEKSGHLLIGR